MAHMGQHEEPAQPTEPVAESEAEVANGHVGFTANRRVIGLAVLLVAVIAAVIAISVACSPIGGGGGADLPGGY